MKVKFLSSACVEIIHDDVKILCDPWLIDGEYYGSWAHYPPFDFDPNYFDDVDFIYISHQHPDHFSAKTLSKLNKKIPVYLHNYHYKFLKNQIESLGFSVIELDHNVRTNVKNDLFINILAADNCNPELCYKFFGCGMKEKPSGSTYNDTMCVIDDGNEVIVNTNDCPFPLAKTSAKLIKQKYRAINLLLVGYNSAGPYPQCFELNGDADYRSAQQTVTQKFFKYAEGYVNLLQPAFVLPFAGRYTLAGKNHILNDKRAAVELEDAYNHFTISENIDKNLSKCIILNSKDSFDLKTGSSTASYIPINLDAKKLYIKNILSKTKYDYEYLPIPKLETIKNLLDDSYSRFNRARKELQFSTDTNLLIQLPENFYLLLSFDDAGFKIINKNMSEQFEKFVKIDLDPRLLHLLLQGPKFANWNNCEVGSHLKFKRNPDSYESAIYYCLNFFHV